MGAAVGATRKNNDENAARCRNKHRYTTLIVVHKIDRRKQNGILVLVPVLHKIKAYSDYYEILNLLRMPNYVRSNGSFLSERDNGGNNCISPMLTCTRVLHKQVLSILKLRYCQYL